jgi:multiple sugar transport system permease protein
MISSESVPVTKTATASARQRRVFNLDELPLHIILLVLLVLMLLPFVWMLATSLKSDLNSTPTSLSGKSRDFGTFTSFFVPDVWQWVNYSDAWRNNYGPSARQYGLFDAPFAGYFFNSIVVGVVQTLGVLVTSILAGYAFARMQFWGKGILFAFILATLAIPHEASYIPNLVIVSLLGQAAGVLGANTYTALILPWIASAFYIFLLRQFFMTIPIELYEAAQLDGISELGYLWRIAVPLATPAVLTVALFTFMGSWNAFMWPLIAAPNIPVVQTGLRTFLGNTEVATQWNLMMAAATIVIVPVVIFYFLVQKSFLEGISRTGIK